ncbi:hypothetical protein CPB85DRAFT_1433686 [Mucidula mucida]|nr:hypothetical protein CPB85DRAFT_1433686 [Mucidula mucida]
MSSNPPTPSAGQSEPVTPGSAFRSRNSAAADLSSSSAFSDSRLAREASRSSFSALNTPNRKTIRSDPALLTCFDPSDRELYDLWAPKS